MTTQHAQQGSQQGNQQRGVSAGRIGVSAADLIGSAPWLQRRSRDSAFSQLARGLGWFGIGFGTIQVVAPGALARTIGVNPSGRTRAIMRVVGVREIATSVGSLAQRWPGAVLWARVAGDGMDLALLGGALRSKRARRGRIVAALAAVAGVAALDTWVSLWLQRRSGATDLPTETQTLDISKTVTINRPPADLYRYWHDFTNLPRFMEHLQSVETLDAKRSHWKTKAPAGTTVEWDAEITEDRPNELIAWRSLPGASVENSGSVRFTAAPVGRGTEVRVVMRYAPPAGVLGATIARLFGQEPSQQARDDLRRFKQVMETGEVTRSEASARGKGPAQPPAEQQRQPVNA